MASIEGIREIIITTARNRNSFYFDKGLGNISEEVYQKVYDKYLSSYSRYLFDERSTINFLIKLFEEVEKEYIDIQLKCKQEYGM